MQGTKVLMCFNRSRVQDVWNILFRIPPRPKPLPRELQFKDPDKIRDLYERFAMKRQLEDRQAFEFALTSGGGIVELMLGPEQLQVLEAARNPAKGNVAPGSKPSVATSRNHPPG